MKSPPLSATQMTRAGDTASWPSAPSAVGPSWPAVLVAGSAAAGYVVAVDVDNDVGFGVGVDTDVAVVPIGTVNSLALLSPGM